jgi:hypothetical protein
VKTENFQLHGNNSVCAVAFQLLRGRVPAQLRGNIDYQPSHENEDWPTEVDVDTCLFVTRPTFRPSVRTSRVLVMSCHVMLRNVYQLPQ